MTPVTGLSPQAIRKLALEAIDASATSPAWDAEDHLGVVCDVIFDALGIEDEETCIAFWHGGQDAYRWNHSGVVMAYIAAELRANKEAADASR